jgi:hypothetical protein
MRPTLQLATILWQRASDKYGLPSPTPASLAEFLSEACGVDPESAQALSWGEEVDLKPTEIEEIAETLDLHQELLACLICPTSSEVLEHVLEKVSEECLGLERCSYCVELAQRIKQDSSDRRSLAIDVLEHVLLEDAPSDTESAELTEELIRVYKTLSANAQMRVVAYAHQERMVEIGPPKPTHFSAYLALREKMSAKACQVIDLVAFSPNGLLSYSSISERLQLSALELAAIIEELKAISIAATQDRHTDEPLVDTTTDDQTPLLRISAEALTAWRALVEANRTEN